MKYLLLILLTLYCFSSQAQDIVLKKVTRLNFLNPGVEYEFPLNKNSTLSTNAGIGYHGSYMNLTKYTPNGFIYMISPFLDIEYRKIFNRDRRLKKGTNLKYNSGNYLGARFLTRGKEISSNIVRTDNVDFSIGPVWGLQRAYGRLHLLFDIGPVYYFDTKGNSGIFPFMIQLNIGLNLKQS